MFETATIFSSYNITIISLEGTPELQIRETETVPGFCKIRPYIVKTKIRYKTL